MKAALYLLVAATVLAAGLHWSLGDAAAVATWWAILRLGWRAVTDPRHGVAANR